MKKIIILTLSALCFMNIFAVAEDNIKLQYNGRLLNPEQPPVVINERTLVPVRAVCDAMGLDIDWNSDTQTIRICDEFNLITMRIGSAEINVNDVFGELDAAPEIINGVTCVPIRDVIEPFGAEVLWDAKSRTVIITDKNADTLHTSAAVIQKKAHSFYSQGDSEWAFASNGRGYCWVCSYAMVLSDLTGQRITPVDVAQYNIDAGGSSGSYMASHFGIADKFGAKFVPALDESSPYFASFETSRRGATYITAETDDDVRVALIEALDRNPHGIMVRFEGYPHTIVATGYYENTVYFNDPAGESLENVEFSGTCLAKSFKLTDISFVQALALK